MSNKSRWQYALWTYPAYALVGLAQALVGVATLGIYVPSWDIAFLFWRAERDLNRRIKFEKDGSFVLKDPDFIGHVEETVERLATRKNK